MATGPEHYRAAERLLVPLRDGNAPYPAAVAIAQVPATLALAAATAIVPGIAGMAPLADYKAWAEVAAVETNDEEPQS